MYQISKFTRKYEKKKNIDMHLKKPKVDTCDGKNYVLRFTIKRTGRLVLKKMFFCLGEYTEYGFDQQRLIWYVDMLQSTPTKCLLSKRQLNTISHS